MPRLDVQDALLLFGGALGVRPDAYPETADGWAQYLRAVRCFRHFKAQEFVTPASGGTSVPPRKMWPNAALCALVADEFRLHAGAPVRVRYLYRSPKLNSERGGAPESDHLSATAVDLQCLGKTPQAAAERARDRFVDCLYGLSGLAVSVGVCKTVTHLGLLSPRGQRRWRY
jgi:hypothetical protein